MTSKYPKLSVSIRPSTKAKLQAVASLEQRAVWRVVEDSIGLYVESLPEEDRRVVDAIVQRAART